MLTCDPPRVLEFEWGEDTLRFQLTRSGPGTELTFTDTLGVLGKAARDGTGWHVCLDRLSCALEGTEVAWEEENAHWREVNAGYVERFGPEASAIGPPRRTSGQRLTSSLREILDHPHLVGRLVARGEPELLRRRRLPRVRR